MRAIRADCALHCGRVRTRTRGPGSAAASVRTTGVVFVFVRMPAGGIERRLSVALPNQPKGHTMATTATKKPARKPAKKPVKKSVGKTSIDYVQEAIADIRKARESVAGEAAEQLDHASDRLRVLASDLRGRAEDEVHEFQSTLESAGEQVRVELGRRAIRAQASTTALTQLSSEIRKRRAELTK
jgi:hypothetical protein